MTTLPAPFGRLPRVKLLFNRPADIEALDRLTSTLNCGGSFWMKREDCNSGLAFGGNKVRKLEYVLADAIAQGADTLVTTGGIQSNHMRQTAAAAARLGLKAALYPQDMVPLRHAEYTSLGNVQLEELLGAEIFPTGLSESDVIKVLRERGRRPYPIPSGASTHPLGGLGYARWVFELLDQEAELGVAFDTIVVAAGSGSTLGGMVAGYKLAQKLGRISGKRKLIGFVVTNKPRAEMDDLVLQIAKGTGDKIGLDPDEVTLDDFELDDGFLGDGYGLLNKATEEAIRELAQLEGILVDPVYTGKAFAGMLHRARAGQLKDCNVLFCHTGGQIALSAYPQLR